MWSRRVRPDHILLGKVVAQVGQAVELISGQAGEEQPLAVLVRQVLVVSERRYDVCVPADDPGVPGAAPENRVVGPQFCVSWVGVDHEVRRAQVGVNTSFVVRRML